VVFQLPSSKESFRLSEAFKKQMKGYEAAVRMPSSDRMSYGFIIHKSIASEPLRQPATCAYIISWEDICPAEAA
jgi:hypothetical protein